MNTSTRYTGIELVPKYNFSLGYAPVTVSLKSLRKTSIFTMLKKMILERLIN